MTTNGGPCQNTDRELWRERPDDYYADSIHVTEGGGVGINRGGRVIVLPLWRWHELAMNELGRDEPRSTPQEGTTDDEQFRYENTDYDENLRAANERGMPIVDASGSATEDVYASPSPVTEGPTGSSRPQPKGSER